jgi:hypothetical protein
MFCSSYCCCSWRLRLRVSLFCGSCGTGGAFFCAVLVDCLCRCSMVGFLACCQWSWCFALLGAFPCSLRCARRAISLLAVCNSHTHTRTCHVTNIQTWVFSHIVWGSALLLELLCLSYICSVSLCALSLSPLGYLAEQCCLYLPVGLLFQHAQTYKQTRIHAYTNTYKLARIRHTYTREVLLSSI